MLCLLLTVTTFVFAARAGEPPPLAEGALRDVARDAVEEWRIAPGIVIGWVSPQGTGVVGYGASGDPARPQVDAETLFEIGSITKTITGLLLADMVNRGEVRLDEPLGALLPEMSHPAAGIPVAALASHHSGLPRMPFRPGLLAAGLFHRGDPYRGIGVEDVIRAVSETRTLDTGFEYSNLGAAVLGQALARRAALPYPVLATQRVLAPLGIESFAAGSPRARGHSVNLQPVPSWTFDGYAPAGGFLASGEDMRRYLAGNLAGTAPGAVLAQRPVARVGPDDQVGLAWMIAERRGGTTTWHNGSTGGFGSWLGFDRDRGVGVVVLANAGNSADELGAWLLGISAAPRPPGMVPVGVLALGALVGWGVLLTAVRGNVPLTACTGWRRKLLGKSRADAAARVVTVLALLGFLQDLVDWRGAPAGTFVVGAVSALVLQVVLLARSRSVLAPPAAGIGGWLARGWSFVIAAVVLWAAWGSPRVG